MGTVYLAERADGAFEQQVAVKLLKRGLDTDEIVRRFEAERQILAELVHPNVARLLDGGTSEDGRPFLVMEYVEGKSIDAYCDARRMTTRQRVELVREVASAVQFAHQHLVVHRDLKPANILVTAGGTPKLLDFGIAKLLRPDLRFPATVTSESGRLMTPCYASPEQVRGGVVTTATDVYGLGVLLYELLSGHRPYRFDAHQPEELARAVCEETPPRLSVAVGRTVEAEKNGSSVVLTPGSVSGVRDGSPEKLRRRLAGDLDNVVAKAMRKEPEERYASVEQLDEDLGRHLDGRPVRARRPTILYHAGKLVRRYPWQMATVIVAVLVIGAVAVMLAQSRKIDRLTKVIVRLSEEVDDPEVRADLLDAIGRVYLDQGLYDEARSNLEAARQWRREALGEGHPLYAASLLNLANLERRIGESDKAEALVRQALSIQRRVFPEGHQDLTRGLNNLASLLREKGDLEEAEVTIRESLAMTRRLLGERHPDVATRLNTLATVLRAQGKLDDAARSYRECLDLRLELDDPASPGVLKVLNNLAGVYEDQGELENALALRRSVLETRRKIYEGDHPQLVTALNNLGLLLADLDELGEAQELVEEALGMQRRLTGPSSRNVAILERSLALVLERHGEYAACEELARQALEALREKASPKTIAEVEGVLGGCLVGQGRFAEAKSLLDSSYATLQETAAASRWLRWTREWLGRVESD